MFQFEECSNVPVAGGRYCYGGSETARCAEGGGLVKVDSYIWWSGSCKRPDVYVLEDDWKVAIDRAGENLWATLGTCGGKLALVGGVKKDGTRSKTVKVCKGKTWSQLPDMLVECTGSCPLSINDDDMVVIGGFGDDWKRMNDVQVFNGQTRTWHKGPPLPQPCRDVSAIVYGDQIFVMGGRGMAREVWSAKIEDLTAAHHQQSVWSKLPDVPYCRSSVCVVDGVLLAIGGTEEDTWGSRETSAICVFNPDYQTWLQIMDMPFEGALLDTVLLSEEILLVVNGYNRRVLRIAVKGLADLFPKVATGNTNSYQEL